MRRAQAGFTLVEILVATSLLALMILGAMAALSSSVRSVRSGEALVSRTDSVRIAQEFMRRQLSQALALPFERTDDLGMVFVFEGGDRDLKFVAPMPGHLARGGPHVQQISIGSGERGLKRIEFTHALLNGYDDPQSGSDQRPPVVVLEGLQDAHFEYRSVDENGELLPWTRNWDYPQFVPMMVRVVAEFPSDRPQHWPQFEVPVHAGASGSVGSFYSRLQSTRERRDRDSDSPSRPPQ